MPSQIAALAEQLRPYLSGSSSGSSGSGGGLYTLSRSVSFDQALSLALTALTPHGGTIVIPPGDYTYSTDVVITPSSFDGPVAILAYGAQITYTGIGDAIRITENTSGLLADGNVYQYAQKSIHFYGLHLLGTSQANCAIRNYGCSFATFHESILENFTNVTLGKANLILDARFYQWVEENHYDGLEMRNAGHGILFISEEDVSGTASSTLNNYFTNCHIWLTQDGGKGIYGQGKGASGLALLGRCTFNGIVIHPMNAANVTAFDLTGCYVEGAVFISPSVDVYGTCANCTFFDYNGTETLTIFGPVAFNRNAVTTFLGGSGKYLVLGGNYPTRLYVDEAGNVDIVAALPTSDGQEIDSPAMGWSGLYQAAGVITSQRIAFKLVPKSDGTYYISIRTNVNNAADTQIATIGHDGSFTMPTIYLGPSFLRGLRQPYGSDHHVERGLSDVGGIAAGATGTLTITLTQSFDPATTPVVTATMQSTTGGNWFNVELRAYALQSGGGGTPYDQIVIEAHNSDAGATTATWVNWTAIGQDSA